MKRDMLLLVAGFLFAFPSPLHAEGRYSIGRDRGGVYMQTDQDGSWYIDRDHLSHFRVGETGTYSTGADALGSYIRTGKGGKFYVDRPAREQLRRELHLSERKRVQEGGVETKVVVEAGQVLVPVLLRYGGNEAEVLLLLDTGASLTVLHREVAERLNMKGIRKGQLRSAGGDAIEADLVKLDSVTAGPIAKKNITAGIIDFKGPSARHRGLLGMNFLEQVHYRIDLKRQTVTWED